MIGENSVPQETGEEAGAEPAADPVNWLKLARDAFSASKTYFDTGVRRRIEDDIRRFNSRHPAGSKYFSESYKHRSKLFRPKTRSSIRRAEATAAEAFFSTEDLVNLRPEDPNNELQTRGAALMKPLLEYRLKNSIPWFLQCIGGYQDALKVGAVVSRQEWEYRESRSGKVKADQPVVEILPLENFRFDPNAKWWDPVNTSPYVIEMIPMYLKDIKARMTVPDPKTGAPKWKPLPDATVLQAKTDTTDSIRNERTPGRADAAQSDGAPNDYTLIWVHRNIVEVDGDDWVFYTLKDLEVLSDPVPLEEVWFHGRRPYVMGFAVIDTHKVYPDSVNYLGKGVQDEINEVTNGRLDAIKMTLAGRYFVKRNKQVDTRSLTRVVPAGVTMLTDLEDVKEFKFTPPGRESFEEQDRLNNEMDEATGTMSIASIQSNRSLNETATGIDAVESSGNLVGGYQLRTFVMTWVIPVLRQLVLLEAKYETDENVLRIVGRQAGITGEVTDELLEQSVVLDVDAGMGATNPVQKMRVLVGGLQSIRELLEDGVLERYGLKVRDLINEVFGKMGYRDGDRFFSTEVEPELAAARATIEQLQQALEMKEPPELISAKVDKLLAETENVIANKVKIGVEAAFGAMSAAQVIAAVPEVAPMADEVMKSAGYQYPVPAGVDPNFPAGPGQAPPAITAEPLFNPKTGVKIEQGGNGDGAVQADEVVQPGQPNTSPGQPPVPPKPPTAMKGIETLRSDSVRGEGGE